MLQRRPQRADGGSSRPTVAIGFVAAGLAAVNRRLTFTASSTEAAFSIRPARTSLRRGVQRGGEVGFVGGRVACSQSSQNATASSFVASASSHRRMAGKAQPSSEAVKSDSWRRVVRGQLPVHLHGLFGRSRRLGPPPHPGHCLPRFPAPWRAGSGKRRRVWPGAQNGDGSGRTSARPTGPPHPGDARLRKRCEVELAERNPIRQRLHPVRVQPDALVMRPAPHRAAA